MRRTTTVLVAVLVVVGTLAAVPTAGLAQTATTDDGTATPDGETATPAGDTTTATDENATATDENATAPGDLLEGVIGVQAAEVEGDLENRTFGIRVAQAATAGAKADVVAERLRQNEERIAALEERRAELNESLANGTITRSEYRAEIAALAVRSHNVERLTNRTANVSAGLPEDVLAERGINVTAIRALSERADRLTGPEVAAIARSIAGPSVADRARERRGPPEDRAGSDRDGRPADRGAASDRGGNRTAAGSDRAGTPDRSGNRTTGGADSGQQSGSGGSADGASGGSGASGADDRGGGPDGSGRR